MGNHRHGRHQRHKKDRQPNQQDQERLSHVSFKEALQPNLARQVLMAPINPNRIRQKRYHPVMESESQSTRRRVEQKRIRRLTKQESP